MFSRSFLAAAISLALIAQAHAAGTASSEQIGNDNLIEIIQESGQDVSAVALQDGDSNQAFLDQRGTELAIQTSQQGTDNRVEVEQDGWDSRAEVSQAGESNVASVFQQPFDNGQLNAFIDQNGQGNESIVLQRDASISWTETSQTGQDNVARIEQHERMNSIAVTQIGERNITNASQDYGSGAEILQTGNDNAVALNQSSSSYISTRIEQSGSFNEADVTQWAGGRFPGGYVDLYQQGEGNQAQVRSGDAWADVKFDQVGDANLLEVAQSTINGNVTGYSKGDFNVVDITQDGADTYVDIAQEGSDNMILVSQTGGIYYYVTDDTGTISQTGTANFASLTQDHVGDDLGTNTASIMQNGVGNSATVTQR
jgi:hypothetical protein